jgi:hypothetical protein
VKEKDEILIQILILKAEANAVASIPGVLSA